MVSVDANCIYTGKPDYGEGGPDYAHLSEVKLVIRVNPSHALLVCKDGSNCLLTTQRANPYGPGTAGRAQTYLAKTSQTTLLMDYDLYPDSDTAIEKTLGNAIRQCQSRPPGAAWSAMLAKAGLAGGNR